MLQKSIIEQKMIFIGILVHNFVILDISKISQFQFGNFENPGGW